MLKRDNVVLEETDCNELVYADDTLLLGSNIEHLQVYMDYIAQVGKEYGLALNWKKIEQMNINCQNMHIHDALGDHITVKQSIRYLGAQLHANGQLEAEIAQKIGLASQEFKVLKRIWNHCNISIRFKFEIFTACVLQRLLYSLETAWLNKSLRNKLDGFYVKCLRQILKISPSHISRVSNHYILQQFNAKPLSKTLLHRQLKLFGKIARMPNEAIVRKVTFESGSLHPIATKNKRRGRPRNTWTTELHKIAQSFAQASDLWHLVQNKQAWELVIKKFCRE